ncbi:hypothetical protein SAMN05428995_10693 [Loktanella sp. DSM 29012]|uniref:DUF1127 domain-containing protein n=1 Tax=Loktanella gaetbuli TaxID=2881335 RepID=A0ABS8BRE5_9RHOB|nr:MULTISPECIES: hypothetical protein [Loktanella]MCB5198281.1 hypothetical protein [Loktanella gaetbuli]SEQ69557.1 hypothetical protein SAMN05428995_10693 [Loktanella sp. DSM 29012]
MTLVETIRTTLQKRAVYEKTRKELRRLPLDVALDLDIDRADADKIAYNAVYR